MTRDPGTTKKIVRQRNQALVLKLIATRPGVSRVDIAKITGLTKMTVGNLAAELLDRGIVAEIPNPAPEPTANPGRNPIALRISGDSPRILGVSIKRGLYQIALGDLGGTIADRIAHRSDEPMTADALIRFVLDGLDVLRKQARGEILGTGIACIGPIDSSEGVVLNPPNFHGIRDMPLADIVRKHTGLPAYLINDGNSGALAEKLYGDGKDIDSFLYLHIMFGIGSGFILADKLYDGGWGQSGGIGHVTINFAGPKCSCGNTGCLELYANIGNIRGHIRDLASLYPGSDLAARPTVSMPDVIDAANTGDSLAIAALDRFCDYLSHALTNVLNLLDLTTIIADYPGSAPGLALETLLARKISPSLQEQRAKRLRILTSRFRGQAPLMGAIGLIADKVFKNELPIFSVRGR